MSRYRGQTIALLTQHGKERVIAPALEPALGCHIQLVTGYDTDQLGTFTRDKPRPGSQLEAARRKVRIGMALSGLLSVLVDMILLPALHKRRRAGGPRTLSLPGAFIAPWLTPRCGMFTGCCRNLVAGCLAGRWSAAGCSRSPSLPAHCVNRLSIDEINGKEVVWQSIKRKAEAEETTSASWR